MSGMAQLYKALHPLVTAAFVGAGYEHQTAFQRQILGVLGPTVSDVIAETTVGCGHLVAAVAWAAHCVLSADQDKLAVVVARNEAQLEKLSTVAKALPVHNFKFIEVDASDDAPPPVARGVRLVIVTPQALRRCRDSLVRCATLVFEDVTALPTRAAVDLIEMAVQVNPNTALCLFASRPPAQVDVALRYLLRRSNRRYLHASRCPTAIFSTVLCQSQAERTELALRIAQFGDLRRVLVMTHNKEVKELRHAFGDEAKLNAAAIHRTTPAVERQRVLADFIQAPFAVLVAMDAFTGVDLTDVDAVIHMYPPQKSMPDAEWDTFVACLQTTGSTARPCLVVTVAAPDEITMVQYYMQKLGTPGPILNVAPSHPDFEDIVRNPEAALLLRGPDPPPTRLAQFAARDHGKDTAAGKHTNAPSPTNLSVVVSPSAAQGKPHGPVKGHWQEAPAATPAKSHGGKHPPPHGANKSAAQTENGVPATQSGTKPTSSHPGAKHPPSIPQPHSKQHNGPPVNGAKPHPKPAPLHPPSAAAAVAAAGSKQAAAAGKQAAASKQPTTQAPHGGANKPLDGKHLKQPQHPGASKDHQGKRKHEGQHHAAAHDGKAKRNV